MTIDISQFFQVFFDEAEELLAEKERLLLAVDISAPDPEDLNAIFRTAHSIKGGASTFGLNDMTEVTHILESLLDRIRKGEMALTAEHVDAFLAAKDILKMQLDGHRNGAPVDQDAVANVRMMLQELSQDVVPVARSVAPAFVQGGRKDPAEKRRARASASSCRKVEQRDVNAMAAELGLLGRVSVVPLGGERHAIIGDHPRVARRHHGHLLLRARPGRPEGVRSASAHAGTADHRRPGPRQGRGRPGLRLFRSARTRLTCRRKKPTTNAATASSSRSSISARWPGLRDTPAAVATRAAPVRAGGTGNQRSGRLTKKPRRTTRPAAAESSSIRVSIEKVDQLINLIGELVITQAMIEQRVDTLDPMKHERLLGSVSQLTRNTRDLQEAVMSIRMMPMDFVFSRFPRMVRDLAAKLGKKVDFITNGAATELDKGLIERIVDPLTHLVRNSIDHGIEMPETRVAAGKTEAGRLFLSAGHQGGNIVIEVSDDGGGLNRERILAKAAQNGLAVSENMSDSEVWQLIFAPGFSTAETVTDVSGRGVGMDVVKRNITAMGGTVDIRSAKGFGTTISISLPLTLAILDGMSIKVGEEVYILPLGFVVESLQPTPDDIKEISGKGRVIKVRGEYLPLIPLYQMFDITPRFTNPCEGIIVILESDGRKAGLFVDDLVGQQQVVVKNLESNYRKVTGISGATILGDGGVSLILDVSALMRSSRQLTDDAIFS